MRKTRLRKVGKKSIRISHAALTKACRQLVVEIRDRSTCQRCGARNKKLEWSHVITRNAPSLIFVPWNSMALCGPRINKDSCHHWFDSNKESGMAWWRETFPERAKLLDAWRHERKRRKIDRSLELAWLTQQIKALDFIP